MASDKQVLREVWEGKLPLCITIAPDEVNSIDPIEKIYVMAPRQSYLPLCCERVAEVFRKAHASGDASEEGSNSHTEVWFEHNGTPLKWHLPIGVLFDLHSDDTNLLPWQLTAHCANFPEGELLHCRSSDVIEAHFISRLKEADYLKHDGDVINAMRRNDHQALWSGVKGQKFEQFWDVNQKLMEPVRAASFKYIPFYIHQRNQPVTQRLFQPNNNNDDNGDAPSKTLAHLLEDSLPQFDPTTSRVVVQGLEPPLETPIQWLSEHLSHLDNFLHIVVRERSS